MRFVANFIPFPAVQKFWKSVKIWQSYRKFKGENNVGRQRRIVCHGLKWRSYSVLRLDALAQIRQRHAESKRKNAIDIQRIYTAIYNNAVCIECNIQRIRGFTFMRYINQHWHCWSTKFSHRKARPPPIICARILWPIDQLKLSQRVVNEWNRLPQHVIEASTVNMFKNRLDKYWRDTSNKSDA